MELQAVLDAFTENPELLQGVTTHVIGTDKGQEIIGNKAEAIFKERISDEISGVHSKYDDDAFTILGEKPKLLEGGAKQKTYDFLKDKMQELADLRKVKDSLSKDAKVIELTQQIEDLKKNGGGAHWEQTFNTERAKWLQEKEDLVKQTQDAQNSILSFKIESDINSGLTGLKFNEDLPQEVRDTYINSVKAQLLKNSKLEGDKVIYLDDNGAQINDAEYKPQSSKGILQERLKSILHTVDTTGGGNAPKVVNSSIETIDTDGKSSSRLILQEGSFKSKSEFINVAEAALIKAGVSRTDKEWDSLKNEAYTRYKVNTLPR